MRDRGDKVVFHLLRRAQLAGHVVDGVAQLADLVVFGLFNAHGKVPLGNFPGAGAHLPHRHHDGPDEVHPREGEQQHDEHPQGDERQNNQGGLLVGPLQGDHVSDGAQQVAAVVPHHPGDGHNLFPGVQFSHPFAGIPLALQGLLVIGHFLVLVGLKSGGGDKDPSLLVQGHNLHVVFVRKGLNVVPHNAGKAGRGGRSGGEPVEQLVRPARQGQLNTVVGGAAHHQG